MNLDLTKKEFKKIQSPPLILIYGGPGIGKTAFGVGTDNATSYKVGKKDHILMNIDFRGADRLECFRMFDHQIESTSDLKLGFKSLAEQDHKMKWLVIDDMSAMEELFVREVCQESNVDNLKKIEYGRGYELAKVKWYMFFSMIKQLQEMKNIGIVLIAHTKIDTMNDPMAESYSYHNLQLDKRSREIIKNAVDAIGFAHKKVMTKQKDDSFGKKELVAIGESKRVLTFAPDMEGFDSKDRFGLPNEIDLDWSIFESELSKLMQQPKIKKGE
jgi:hypothetical protein